MTTTNALSTMLQNYYRSKMALPASSATAASAGTSAASSSSTSSTADSATISNAAIQAYLASELQRINSAAGIAGDAQTSSLADLLTPAGNTNAAPTTAKEALEQARISMLKAEQAFLSADTTRSTDNAFGQNNDPSTLMTLYTSSINQQVARTIEAAQTRMAAQAKATTPR